MGGQLKHKIQIKWSPNFAYAIGLIASDGWLNIDGRHLGFISKDLELALKFKEALLLSNSIRPRGRGGETEKRYYGLSFGDKTFYQFLNSIGITSGKSKTIKSVSIPDEYFADFLRGLFDGDGTFYSFQDVRWPNSYGYRLSWASASTSFIKWLKQTLNNKFGVRGFIKKGNGVYNLDYTKGDTRKLASAMYYRENLLFFSEKHSKVMNALQLDNIRGKQQLQKSRMPQ